VCSAPFVLTTQVNGASRGPAIANFADLDLSAYGFEVLFAAEWLRQAQARASDASQGWSAIADGNELRRWETAWGESPVPRRFFRKRVARRRPGQDTCPLRGDTPPRGSGGQPQPERDRAHERLRPRGRLRICVEWCCERRANCMGPQPGCWLRPRRVARRRAPGRFRDHWEPCSLGRCKLFLSCSPEEAGLCERPLASDRGVFCPFCPYYSRSSGR
jgi:hypothetical protein